MKKKMNILKNIIFVLLVVLSFSSTAYAQKVTSDTAVVKGNIQFYGTKKQDIKQMQISGLSNKGKVTDTKTRIEGTARWNTNNNATYKYDGNTISFEWVSFDNKGHNVCENWTWTPSTNGDSYYLAIKCITIDVADGYNLELSVTNNGADYLCGFANNKETFYKSSGIIYCNKTKSITLEPGHHEIFFYFNAGKSLANVPTLNFNFVGREYTLKYIPNHADVGKTFTEKFKYKDPKRDPNTVIKNPTQAGFHSYVNLTIEYENGAANKTVKLDRKEWGWDSTAILPPDKVYENWKYIDVIELGSNWLWAECTAPAAPQGPIVKLSYDCGNIPNSTARRKFSYWEERLVFPSDGSYPSSVQPGEKMTVNSDERLIAQYSSDVEVVLSKTIPQGPNRYSAKLDLAGGVGIKETTVKGYAVFNCWKVDSNRSYLSSFDPGDTVTIKDDTTAYAEFRDYDKVVLPTVLPTKEGYDFLGWEYEGGIYKPGSSITISSDQTFKAVWKKATGNSNNSNSSNTGNVTNGNNSSNGNVTNNNDTAKWQIYAKCKKQKGVSGYRFKLSTNKKFKKTKKSYSKVITTKKNEVTFKNLPKKGTYYVKCCSYKKKGKKKVFSKWSKVKKITIK